MANKRNRRRKNDLMLVKLIAMVAVVLVVFEGRMILTMCSIAAGVSIKTASVKSVSQPEETGESNKSDDAEMVNEKENETIDSTVVTLSAEETSYLANPIAGLLTLDKTEDPEAAAMMLSSVATGLSSDAIVPYRTPSVSDSYFKDAVFIGDSRMEGFRNTSGITAGTFFTSVGMSMTKMENDALFSLGDQKVTAVQAVGSDTFGKIYLMFGANDLGTYSWDQFRESFINVTQQFCKLQPDAILYVCSVVYVEEAKVSSSYINNTNVDKINSILLDVCEEYGYYYLDLNEVLSNGFGSLIDGASSDGVHLYADYCKIMLQYLKCHYI